MNAGWPLLIAGPQLQPEPEYEYSPTFLPFINYKVSLLVKKENGDSYIQTVEMAAMMPGSEEQARLLEEALGVVKQQTATMRRCLETPGKLMDALKCW